LLETIKILPQIPNVCETGMESAWHTRKCLLLASSILSITLAVKYILPFVVMKYVFLF